MSEEQNVCTRCRQNKDIFYVYARETMSSITDFRLCEDCAKALLSIACQLNEFVTTACEHRLKGPTDAR